MTRRAALLLSLLLAGCAAASAAPPLLPARRPPVVRAVAEDEPEPSSSDAAENNPDAPGAPGRLRWQNGETLPGEMVGASEDALTWKTPMFDDPLVLDWAALRRYDHPLAPTAPADPFAFTLRGGGHLYGDLRALGTDTLTIRSTRHGDATLRRSEVLSARRVERGGLPAGGATGEAGWQPLSDQPGENGARAELATSLLPLVPPLATGPGGVLALPYWNTGAFRAVELPARLVVQFRVRAAGRPDFLFSLEPATGEAMRVETWDDELVLASDDQFLSLGPLADVAREVALTLCWDRVANRCQVYTPAGELIADWQWRSTRGGTEINPALSSLWGTRQPARGGAENGGPRHAQVGVALRNKGRDLALELLRVRAWDGAPPDQADPTRPGIVLADGRTIPGEPAAGPADTLRLQLGASDAVAGFPLAEVDAIVFPAKEAAVPPDPVPILTWADGTFLPGRMVGLADGRAAVRIAAADAPLPARLDGLRRLQLPAAGSLGVAGKEAPLAERDRLTAGGLTLHGELVGGEDGQARWLPVGGRAAVLPARGAAYEIQRAKPTPPDATPAPAWFYTRAGDILPGTLRGLDEAGVDLASPYVAAARLGAADLDAVQFNTSVPARVEGFASPGWQPIRGDAGVLRGEADTLRLEPGAALAHPSVMGCSELGFQFVSDDAVALRLRLFAPDDDGGAGGVALMMFRSGQTLYYGLETREGQMEDQHNENIPLAGPLALRLVVTEQAVEIYAADRRLGEVAVPSTRRTGGGLVLEAASLGGSAVRAVELAGFWADFVPGRVGLPTVNAEAKREALTVPRFRKDDPPRQALLALNGDVLRGELLAATADHFAFRTGLETLRVPRARVRAAVWLQPPLPPGGPPPAVDPATATRLSKRCQYGGQYSNMRLRDYVGMVLQWDQDLRPKFLGRDSNRRASIRFDQPTVGEALDQVCTAFGLSYHLEGDTVVFAPAGTLPPGLQQTVHWLRADAFPGPAPAQEALAARGITFAGGAAARWDADRRELTMVNTPESQGRLAELLRADGTGTDGPTHWLQLADGTRLGLAVDRFEAGSITGHHPVYGRCTVPLARVASVRTVAPEPDPAVRAFADWRLRPAPEPVLPTDGSPGAALVGTEPAAFRLPMAAGGTFDLAEERGKVVVLTFWATWSAPCVQGLPGLVDALADFPGDKVWLVGVDQSEPIGQVRRFVEARGWQFAVAMDGAQHVAKAFEVDAIPYTVVIGPDGKVARVWAGAEPGRDREVADTVRKLLAPK